MMATLNVEPIHPDERLGRGVFSSKTAMRAKRSISHHVFLERPRTRNISVDRLDKTSIHAALKNADSVAIGRGRTFYGWAVIQARKAARNGRIVQASPIEENPHHADITLPSDNRDEQISHARELANAAHWRTR